MKCVARRTAVSVQLEVIAELRRERIVLHSQLTERDKIIEAYKERIGKMELEACEIEMAIEMMKQGQLWV